MGEPAASREGPPGRGQCTPAAARRTLAAHAGTRENLAELGELAGCARFPGAATESGGSPGIGAPIRGLAGRIARDRPGAVFTWHQSADGQPAGLPGVVCVLPDPARPGGDGLLALGDDRRATWPRTRQVMTADLAHLLQGLVGYGIRKPGSGDGCLVTGTVPVAREAGR
jgi:hypothetical protein